MNKTKIVGISVGVLTIIISGIFLIKENMDAWLFFVGVSIAVMVLPFVVDVAVQNKREDEMSIMFLEFTRNLAESVATGTPISKSIVNLKSKNYGSLGPHIEKLANQISLGIPLEKSLKNFAYDVNSNVITRAVALIKEAEKAGGEIEYILESVARSISEIERLKRERKAAISNLVVQGYIIFFVFIGIVLIMQHYILPLTSNLGDLGSLQMDEQATGIGGITGGMQGISSEAISDQFLYLLLAQGFFAGLAIGKLTEGKIKAGVKHSFILTVTAYLVFMGSKILIGTPAG